MKKVLIAIPALDHCSTEFALSLATALNRVVYEPTLRREVGLALACQRGSNIMDARNNLIEEAIRQDVTHIFFWDSDMLLPPNTIDRLLAHKADIVGATYARRSPPYTVLGKRDNTALAMGDLEPYEHLPFGCILINMKIIPKLERPYFRYLTTPTGSMSEDTYFCNMARVAGLTIYCDMKLSKEVGHVGTTTYRIPQ